ncbi:MAG TPA: AGE family epimerase/isomerase [archaeon]|nr:AGE family epimerase/isomerase [archaeon]
MAKFEAGKYLELFRRELLEHVIPFWLEHSLDREMGGYFTCLERDGRVYDTTKYMWLQSRQVWMLSRLYNTLEKNDRWLEAARLGCEFIKKYGRDSSGRVYFSLTREGRPLFIQRKVFAECFYIMALDEYSRAVEDKQIKQEAVELFGKFLEWSDNPVLLGRPVLEGQKPASSLALAMSALWIADQLGEGGSEEPYRPLIEKSVREILLHRIPEKKIVLENVAPDGTLLDSPEGRLMNPGHAIEAGWFVLEEARKSGDEEIKKQALQMIEWSFEKGWDTRHGGIFYFLDAEGFPPMQLEWFMKLWWPHCEAIYAFLSAYRETGEKRFADYFGQVVDYAFSRFSDPGFGEWYGYLDRQGRPTHTLKGGPYKGCFHVPRFLLLSIGMLEKMV